MRKSGLVPKVLLLSALVSVSPSVPVYAQNLRTSSPGMVLSQKQEALVLKAQSPLAMPHVYHPCRIRAPFTDAKTGLTDGYAIIDGYLYEGLRGGERQFELVVSLDSTHIYSSSGISTLEVVLCSRTPTNVSEDIFELNVNEYDGRVTYSDITQLKVDQDMFSDQIQKFPDMLFKVLRVSSTEKGFTRSLFDLVQQIYKNEQMEADIAQGNEIIGDRMYGVWYKYHGKGDILGGALFDEDIGAKQQRGKVHRAPKVVRFHFKEGGKNTEGILVRAVRWDYLPDRQVCKASAAFPFNVEEAFRTWSVVK